MLLCCNFVALHSKSQRKSVALAQHSCAERPSTQQFCAGAYLCCAERPSAQKCCTGATLLRRTPQTQKATTVLRWRNTLALSAHQRNSFALTQNLCAAPPTSAKVLRWRTALALAQQLCASAKLLRSAPISSKELRWRKTFASGAPSAHQRKSVALAKHFCAGAEVMR